MCGIAGIWSVRSSLPVEAQQSLMERMLEKIRHRGPDAGRTWSAPEVGLSLGHRRLAIIDLSETGIQPMVTPDGRWVISFNGEIYNYAVMRQELLAAGRIFKGQSDTEVLLAAIAEWGIAGALSQCVGMFAFAVYDRQERRLWLARDRMGEKPLYYGWSGRHLVFASELKALRAAPDWCGAVDRNALSLYFRHNYIPTPYTIYAGIRKLSAGCFIEFNLTSDDPGHMPEPEPYWSVKAAVEAGQASPYRGDWCSAADELEGLIQQSVARQMIADVPLGAFLSGGVDSSLVVACMQSQSTRPVKTFTIGFAEEKYDEAKYAKEVARHIGTEHTELYVTSDDALSVIPKLPEIYDEPFSDSSQIPTYLVSALARKHVTVCLSGDGGDEIFGGYTRYMDTLALWSKISSVPDFLRGPIADTIGSVGPEQWEKMLGWLAKVVGGSVWQGRTGDRLHKAAKLLQQSDPSGIYLKLMTRDSLVTPRVWGDEGHRSEFEQALLAKTQIGDLLNTMTYLDLVAYLPDDILVKVDRAGMAVSLEGRIPFLDHNIIEFASRLPTSMKVRGKQGKWLLKQVLFRYVPQRLVERPKMGFGVPIEYWLSGPLNEWAQDLLDQKRIEEEGYLDAHRVQKLWKEHQSGQRKWHYHLWDILMFQAWLAGQK